MTPTLVFDIETIPDVAGLRTLLELPADVSDEEVANIALHQRRQHNGTEFLPLHQHRVCAISCALREGNQFKVWTLGDSSASEAEIIQRFLMALKNILHKSFPGTAVALICLYFTIAR